MARNAFVRVHERKVQEYIEPGGEVYGLVHNVGIYTKAFAAEHINSRSGKLVRSLQVNRPSRKHTFALSSLVFARASYGIYVHGGTSAITPQNGKYLTVPKNHKQSTVPGGTLRKAWRGNRAAFPDGAPYFTTKIIRGQTANPFLAKGLREAMDLIAR